MSDQTTDKTKGLSPLLITILVIVFGPIVLCIVLAVINQIFSVSYTKNTAPTPDYASRDATSIASQVATINARNSPTTSQTVTGTTEASITNTSSQLDIMQIAMNVCKDSFIRATFENHAAIVECEAYVKQDDIQTSEEALFDYMALAKKLFMLSDVNIVDYGAYANFTDNYGNKSHKPAIRIRVTKTTADRIKWSEINGANLVRLLVGPEKGNGNMFGVMPSVVPGMQKYLGFTLPFTVIGDIVEGMTQPTPTPPGNQQVYITAIDTVNIRSGPGTNYAVIAPLFSSIKMMVTGKNVDASWLQFTEQGDKGWVLASLVTVSGDLSSVPIVNAP